MPILSWWDKASVEDKEQAIRVLNKKTFSLGTVKVLGLREFAKYKKGFLTGDVRHTFVRKMRATWQPVQDRHDQLTEVLNWRDGAPLPRDIRTCRYKPCGMFFLVRKSRKTRVFHSRKCGSNYHASKSMNRKIQKARERKLKRVRKALRVFGKMADWKRRAARRARVTEKFITHAIRRKELRHGMF